MVRKALVVGVSEYLPLKANLRSSTVEVENWKRLLIRTYSFAEYNVRVLVNERATKRAILDRLIWLLADACERDQIVFVFCGHGVRARRRDSSGRPANHEDEGLLPFPAGSTSALDISIFDDDLTDLYRKMCVPRSALPTFIFDCCYSAGLDFSATHRGNRPVPSHAPSSVNVVHFGLRLARGDCGPKPIVIAASGETGLAIETDVGGMPRSLFSFHALNSLHRNPALSYQNLIDQIRPDMEYAAQVPDIRGDEQRKQRAFLT